MATSAPYFYPQAQFARSMASSPAGGDVPLQIAIQAVIETAIAAGLFTTTISLSAYTPLQIQAQMEILRGLGYTVSYSGSTLTISW